MFTDTTHPRKLRSTHQDVVTRYSVIKVWQTNAMISFRADLRALLREQSVMQLLH